MNIFPKIFILTVTVLLTSITNVDAALNKKQLHELIDSYAENRNFNGTVLVAHGGKIIVEASYGEANVEWAVPNIPTARYRIGSLTKPLTATLTMRLVEEGVLSLDGTLGSYLPTLYAGTDLATVTLAQLLSHTSGITDIPGNFNDPWWQTTARISHEPETFAKEWIKPTLVSQPGSKWRYNNAGFILLGLVIETVTHQSYAENLEQWIFAPAGMNASGVFSNKVVLEGLAKGYSPTPEGTLEQALPVDPSVLSSAASVYATVGDIYRFDRALYEENKILTSQSRRKMHSVQGDGPYGYGWGVEAWPQDNDTSLPVVSHTGSIPGYQSYYLRSETNEDCVIVISNKNQGGLVVAMGRDLMQVLHGKSISFAKKSLEDLLLPIAYKDDTAAMIAAYDKLGSSRKDYDLSERALNQLGYKLLRLNKIEEAIAVFEWAVSLYPNSANTHDSLGEAFRAAGHIEQAINSYEKAIKLDPESPSAAKALKEMKQ